MNSFFKSDKCKMRISNNVNFTTTKSHIPFVPVFVEEDQTNMNDNEKYIYLLKEKRRNIYRLSVNGWLDEPLFDTGGIVYEFPKEKDFFMNDLLYKYKNNFIKIHCQEYFENEYILVEDEEETNDDENNEINKNNIITYDEYEELHGLKFIMLNNDTTELYQNYIKSGINENYIFVTENELIESLSDSEINEYNVIVRDVLRTIYKQVLELIFTKGFDICDISAFKDDFIHFMYILSDIDSEKLINQTLHKIT